MENNKSQFKRTGVLHDGAECIEIQISHSGDAARYVSTIKFTVRDPEVTRGRWQEIRYSKRNATARETLQQEKRLCVYCEVRQETIFVQISKNILTWQQKTINLSTCYSTGFNAIAITILATAAETLSIVFGPMMSRNKSIKCESFMTCCRLNLNGLQENKLMNMQQE